MASTSVTRLRRCRQENQELKVILDCISSPGSVSKTNKQKRTYVAGWEEWVVMVMVLLLLMVGIMIMIVITMVVLLMMVVMVHNDGEVGSIVIWCC